MKRNLLLLMTIAIFAAVQAGPVDIQRLRYAGPFSLKKPVILDSVDVNNKAFDPTSLLQTPLNLHLADEGKTIANNAAAPNSKADYALHLLQFPLESTAYGKVKLTIEGLKNHQVYLDDKQVSTGELALEPGIHSVVIKYLSQRDSIETLKVSIDADSTVSSVIGKTASRHLLDLADITDGRFFSSVDLSPDGKYMITSYREVQPGGQTNYKWILKNTQTNETLEETGDHLYWMPRENSYFRYDERADDTRAIVVTNVETRRQRTLVSGIPEGEITLSPMADYLIISTRQEEPAQDKDLYNLQEPDDRIPGWRARTTLQLMDVKTGLVQPLTFGYRNVDLLDISDDGQHLLLMTKKSRLTQRPTTLYSLLDMNLTTMRMETLVADDGFISDACYSSPDGRQIAVMASPEAFDGCGKNVPEGRIPSMYDYQLYTVEAATKQVTPLTRDFNPSVINFQYSVADGQLYFTANDKDYIRLFRTTPKGTIEMLPVPEELVTQFSISRSGNLLAWFGESASNGQRSYILDTKTGKNVLKEDLSAERLKGVELGACEEWDFTNSRGDTICGRFYLPPRFNPKKKYPLIVNYYGGCSPTPRYFMSRYPHHVYAAKGYVVYVLQPSGAAGFGQEFSSRHVNTAGDGVVDDIIEGTKAFCRQHRYVDAKKIGCIGASYGGFMTQYLQTKTDLFAAAISHAGISDHVSYWGQGYWGYSYSEVSMANSYPWKDRDLYVEHSPLYHVDKIHTPLLFLHGTADTNVPVGESIQMFNALKLLGRETAFVMIEGENHHILDYQKRVKWQNTIFAWFAKYLQGQAGWWNALYGQGKF